MSVSQPAPVSIRLARREDISYLTKLQVDAIQALSASYYNEEQMQVLIRNKSKNRTWREVIFIAEIENQMVGFSALSLNSPIINGIYVHPTFIRQGIGRKLLTALEEEALKSRVRCLWVSAALNAVGFYQAQGYQIIKENKIWLGYRVPIPVIVMKKVLRQPTRSEIIATTLMYGLLFLFLLLSVILRLLAGG